MRRGGFGVKRVSLVYIYNEKRNWAGKGGNGGEMGGAPA